MCSDSTGGHGGSRSLDVPSSLPGSCGLVSLSFLFDGGKSEVTAS